MFAKPCTCKQTTGVTQRGHEDKHDGMCHRMTVERQRHDQAGGKQRNVQNGEHGDCHMAQSAVAHFTLFMIERRFETSTCIGVRQFVRHGQGKPTAERYLGTCGDRYKQQGLSGSLWLR